MNTTTLPVNKSLLSGFIAKAHHPKCKPEKHEREYLQKAIDKNEKCDDLIVLMMDEFKRLKMAETLMYYRDMAIRIGVEFDHDRYSNYIPKYNAEGLNP